MHAPTIPSPTVALGSNTRVTDTIGSRLTLAHDGWMADGDRFLSPITSADATFWERWAGVRYVKDQLLARFRLERDLLDELRPFLTAEIRERLQLQADRIARLLTGFERLAGQRETARELAHTTRELIEALRLWYAEIEFAAGGIRWSDVSGEGHRLLAEVNRGRCGWADARA